MVRSEEHWQVENPQTTGKKHAPGHGLHREFRIGPNRVDVVVDAQQENQGAGQEDRKQVLGGR